MVATVSIARMDRLKDGWNRVVPEVSAVDLNAIRTCVVNALQLKNVILETQSAAMEAIAAAAGAKFPASADGSKDVPNICFEATKE
jgi:uncharacterized membrane protein YoaK (UPF0700 family)